MGIGPMKTPDFKDSYPLLDAHCHLDLMPNGEEVARSCADLNTSFLATTVTPQGYQQACKRFSSFQNVRVALGAHPWWIADGRLSSQDMSLFCELAEHERYIGEVGIDLSPHHVDPLSQETQSKAFGIIAQTAAHLTKKTGLVRVLSIHSVRSSEIILDMLERTGCVVSGPASGKGTRDAGLCRCIFHWFTGSCEELWRAIRSGCRFSINERMLATKRGREYCRLIPDDRLLLETDLPETYEAPTDPTALITSLYRTLEGLAKIRNCPADELACRIDNNTQSLFV